MKYIFRTCLLLVLTESMAFGQNFTSYLTGSTTDMIADPWGGVCLMGGATEDDNAMRWFLQQANGGDILVLRATGSDGYNDYFYSTLGIPVNSVETIVCNNSAASADSYVLQKIQQAEAIWFAGGDQWTYISYWRNSAVDSLINQAIQERNIVIGGTSAGMAIQGKFYFSAQNGTVTSAAALANPFNSLVTVDSTSFIQNNYLDQVITDTHFDNPDRRGRLTSFLARIAVDFNVFGKAIACDEYTSVCIDTNGIARVFGGFPTYDDNAYFIQTNCALPSQLPETCTSGNPLTWNLGAQAIKVYNIQGNSSGSNTFNLADWETGTGGEWFDWSVNNGVFSEQTGNPLNCNPLSLPENNGTELLVSPNPTSGKVSISLFENKAEHVQMTLHNTWGQQMTFPSSTSLENSIELDLTLLPAGLYYVTVTDDSGINYRKVIIKE